MDRPIERSPPDRIAAGVLVRARCDARLTQKELATRMGRCASFIRRLERGARPLHRAEFCAFARALELEPRILFDEIVAAI